MEQRISETDERRMLRAIDNAEMVAGSDDALDRSRVIADALMREHVDKRFAKTAAAAFNKRITVNTLSHTPDSEKPAPFPISDPEMVYQLMGGEAGQLKSASAEKQAKSDCAIVEEMPTMTKAASVPSFQPQASAYCTAEKFEKKLLACLQKSAACIADVAHDVSRSQTNFDNARKAFDKAASTASPAEMETVAALYGAKIRHLTDVELPVARAKFVSTGSELEKRAASLISADLALSSALADKQRCGELSCILVKTAEEYENDKKASLRMRKTSGLLPILGVGSQAISLASAVPNEIINAGTSLVNNTSDTYNNLYENAEKKYDAGRDLDNSPGKVLTAEFINRDRYGDRLMNISDMLADKSLQSLATRTKDIMDAANKAMDTDMSLERRDRSEVLRAAVADLLMQNNRQNMASINALTGVAKNLNSSDKSTIANNAKELSSKLQSITAPALVSAQHVKLPSLYTHTQQLDTAIKDVIKYREEKGKKEQTDKDTEQALFAQLLTEKYGDSVHIDSSGNIFANGAALPKSTISALRQEAKNLRETFGNSAETIMRGNKSIADAERKANSTEQEQVKSLVFTQLENEVGDYTSVRATATGGLEFLDSAGGVIKTFTDADIAARSSIIRTDIRTLGRDTAKANIDNKEKANQDILAGIEKHRQAADDLTRQRLLRAAPGGRVLDNPSGGVDVYRKDGTLAYSLDQNRLAAVRNAVTSEIYKYNEQGARDRESLKARKTVNTLNSIINNAKTVAETINNDYQMKRNYLQQVYGLNPTKAEVRATKVVADNGSVRIIPPYYEKNKILAAQGAISAPPLAPVTLLDRKEVAAAL